MLAEVPQVDIVAITMLSIGSALGLRFRIFVLLPVMLVGLFATICIGLAQGKEAGSIVLCGVIGAASLQAGYVASALFRFLIFSRRICATRAAQSTRPFAG